MELELFLPKILRRRWYRGQLECIARLHLTCKTEPINLVCTVND
jgi:hypothetical protein